jgi:hypothetical protein
MQARRAIELENDSAALRHMPSFEVVSELAVVLANSASHPKLQVAAPLCIGVIRNQPWCCRPLR